MIQNTQNYMKSYTHLVSRFNTAISKCFAATYGDFDFKELHETNPILATIWSARVDSVSRYRCSRFNLLVGQI